MEKQFDLYWTFRSPYCYLAGGWLLDLVRDIRIDLQVQAGLPMAIKIGDFIKTRIP